MRTKKEMNSQKKERAVYEKPAIEVIEMELESVICQASSGDFNPGGGFGG